MAMDTVDRGPWHKMIDRQALAHQAQFGGSYEQAYTKCYTDPSNAAIVNQLKYEHIAKSHDVIFGTRLSSIPVQKAAPYDPLAKAAEHAELLGPNHAKMHSMAIDHQRSVGGSYQSAYAHVYTRTENQPLRNAVKREHLQATMAGYSDDEPGKAAPADPKQDYVNLGSDNWSATDELKFLVAKRMKAEPKLSHAQAFTREYLHEDNRSLKSRYDSETAHR